MNVKIFFILSYLFFQCSLARAQEAENYTWWNPVENNFPVIEGQAWPQEVKNPYDRLPGRAEKQVRPRVWELSHDAAGLSVSFMASTPEIVVKYKVKNKLFHNLNNCSIIKPFKMLILKKHLK